MLKFDKDQHRYYDEDGDYTPVTTYVNSFCKPFNAEDKAKELGERYGFAPEYYLAKWEAEGNQAREFGTEVHHELTTEIYMGLLEPVIFDSTDIGLAFRAELFEYFMHEIKKITCVTEQMVWSKKHRIAGTFDLLITCEVLGKLTRILIDFKTGKEIEMFGYDNEVMAVPYTGLPDSKWGKLVLQLATYGSLINEQLGFYPDIYLGVHIDYDNEVKILDVTKLAKEIRL